MLWVQNTTGTGDGLRRYHGRQVTDRDGVLLTSPVDGKRILAARRCAITCECQEELGCYPSYENACEQPRVTTYYTVAIGENNQEVYDGYPNVAPSGNLCTASQTPTGDTYFLDALAFITVPPLPGSLCLWDSLPFGVDPHTYTRLTRNPITNLWALQIFSGSPGVLYAEYRATDAQFNPTGVSLMTKAAVGTGGGPCVWPSTAVVRGWYRSDNVLVVPKYYRVNIGSLVISLGGSPGGGTLDCNTGVLANQAVLLTFIAGLFPGTITSFCTWGGTATSGDYTVGVSMLTDGASLLLVIGITNQDTGVNCGTAIYRIFWPNPNIFKCTESITFTDCFFRVGINPPPADFYCLGYPITVTPVREGEGDPVATRRDHGRPVGNSPQDSQKIDATNYNLTATGDTPPQNRVIEDGTEIVEERYLGRTLGTIGSQDLDGSVLCLPSPCVACDDNSPGTENDTPHVWRVTFEGITNGASGCTNCLPINRTWDLVHNQCCCWAASAWIPPLYDTCNCPPGFGILAMRLFHNFVAGVFSWDLEIVACVSPPLERTAITCADFLPSPPPWQKEVVYRKADIDWNCRGENVLNRLFVGFCDSWPSTITVEPRFEVDGPGSSS